MIKQINNVYEKDLNERLKTIGITASQCAVLDYLFHTSKEEVSPAGCGAQSEPEESDCHRTAQTA